MTRTCFLFIITLLIFCAQTHIVHAKEKLNVVTTFTVIADIARNVAGDAANVESITKAGAEIHDYQPTPKDIVRARKADLILWNGLNLERWFERFVADMDDVPSVVVSDGVTPLSIYNGPYSGKPNPHAWMSTTNALIYIENIRQALSLHDPKNKETYALNAQTYAHEIKNLREEINENIANIPVKYKHLVTSEGAFSYLANDFDLQEVYLWPINAEQQGTSQQMRAVIDTVRANNIPVVFSESTVSDKPARQVASETNALYGGVLYVDSLSEKDGPVPTYLDLLRVTTKTISDGFNTALNARKNQQQKTPTP